MDNPACEVRRKDQRWKTGRSDSAPFGAGEARPLRWIASAVVMHPLRIGAERVTHCDALGRLVVAVLCRRDRVWGDTLLDPTLKRALHIEHVAPTINAVSPDLSACRAAGASASSTTGSPVLSCRRASRSTIRSAFSAAEDGSKPPRGTRARTSIRCSSRRASSPPGRRTRPKSYPLMSLRTWSSRNRSSGRSRASFHPIQRLASRRLKHSGWRSDQ